MSEYGVDLAEWYAAGRWVALLDYIDMLPTACRLNEAIVNDKETAAELARGGRPEGDWAPRVAEFDLNAHLLREVLHELKQVKQNTLSAAGGKPGPEKPFPAPRTEFEKALAAVEREWAVSFAAQFGFTAEDI